MKHRKAHDPHDRVGITFPEKGRAKQSFKEECDINTIMSKYEKTGLIEHVNTHAGSYGDVSGEADYQAALDTVMRAQDMFATLPAKIRARFENSPGRFLEFVEDPNNLAEMQEMGLLPPTPPTPTKPESNLKVEPGVKPEQPAKPATKDTPPVE